MKIKVNASILEDGLIEELEQTIKENPELFKDSEVALMPDAHKTGGVPVGFTMTIPHKRVAPDFISSDIACGMTSLLIKDWQPTNNELKTLSYNIRDLIQVNKRYDEAIIDLGTLGGGNHFLEIGVNGNDTLITVHSGSRGMGGEVFKKWKNKAQEQYKKELSLITKKMLEEIEPKDRQEWLKNNKPKPKKIDYIDLSKDKELETNFITDYLYTYDYAEKNRKIMINIISDFFKVDRMGKEVEVIICPHNYIDFKEEVWVIRKGSIKAIKGQKVIIPINMRDGIIIGKVNERGEFNNSLPHGAGRILSRTKAFEMLDLETFKNDMKDVISPTVMYQTLDESPRVYKDVETIIKDIGDGLDEVRVFKSVFNYKGVEK